MTAERLVFTGLGLISPLGHTSEVFWEKLLQAQRAAAFVERFDVSAFRASSAALVTDFDPDDYVDIRAGRRMNRLSQMALAASRMAFQDAGEFHGERTGVCFGTGFGCLATTESYMEKLFDTENPLADAFDFPESVANAPAGNVAIQLGCKGPNTTVTHREGSAGIAAVQAALAIRGGYCDAAIGGGLEEMTPHLYHALDRLGSIAQDTHAKGPFDARRSGLIPGEGAGAYLLEPRERAHARGVRVYGELAGIAMANDFEAPLTDWSGKSEVYERTMAEALDSASLHPRDVDALVASANGTRKLDTQEARAIENVFGPQGPWVTSVKGHVGEFAGAGVFSLLAALMMLRSQTVFPIAGFETPESILTLRFAASPQQTKLRNILVNFFSVGGSCTSLVLQREGE